MTALTVLYVDDDPDIREIASLSLALDGGIQVRTAESGAAALALLEDGFQPDVILLDVMMPDMDGPGALAAIRERSGQAETPVIFITARVMRDEQDRFLSLGAKAVIAKPFDPMSLAADVRTILARA